MHQARSSDNKRPGVSLIEIAIAIGVLTIGIASTSALLRQTADIALSTVDELKATALAEEGLEAVVSIRDRNYSNLSDGNKGLAIDATPKWVFSGTTDQTEGRYNRTLIISTVDSNTKKVISRVTWAPSPNRTATVELRMLITKWPNL